MSRLFPQIDAGAARPPADAAPQRRELARAIRSAWCQVFGVPDYERYLDHLALHHPEATPPTRGQFFADAIDRRYGRMGPRCC